MSSEQLIRSWLPDDVKPVVARSAGRALGMLARDKCRVYSGIILDHDLQEPPAAEVDRLSSGHDLVGPITWCVPRYQKHELHSPVAQ